MIGDVECFIAGGEEGLTVGIGTQEGAKLCLSALDLPAGGEDVFRREGKGVGINNCGSESGDRLVYSKGSRAVDDQGVAVGEARPQWKC